MASFQKRPTDFNYDSYPDEEISVELLCTDNVGTYIIPFACCRFEHEWRNVATHETLTANVIGWRIASEERGYGRLRKK